MLDDIGGGDYRDFRCKITSETAAVLDALNHVSGEDRSAIARAALHEWALSKIHEAKVIARLAPREGTGQAAGGAKA